MSLASLFAAFSMVPRSPEFHDRSAELVRSEYSAGSSCKEDCNLSIGWASAAQSAAPASEIPSSTYSPRKAPSCAVQPFPPELFPCMRMYHPVGGPQSPNAPLGLTLHAGADTSAVPLKGKPDGGGQGCFHLPQSSQSPENRERLDLSRQAAGIDQSCAPATDARRLRDCFGLFV